MVQIETILDVCDNSGAKLVKCLKILNYSKKKYAGIGDILKVCIKKISLNSKLKKGDIYNSILIRTISKYKRFDGTYIGFNENSVLLLNNKNEILGTRVFGPVPKELKNNIFISKKISSVSSSFI